jgi:hypothetical protein
MTKTTGANAMSLTPPPFTPQPYRPVAPYESPRRERRSLRPLHLLLVPILFVGFMVFGVSYFISPEPDIKLQPGIGVAVVDGRDVVLAPYQRMGARGVFQVMTKDMTQVRLAATDPATGEVLWDTQLSDELIRQAAVLAVGERYAYVVTESGLTIVDFRNGSVVAKGNGIEGIGEAFVAEPAAYGYDAQNRRVMSLNANGSVLAIPLDTAAATPMDQPTTQTWVGMLSVEGSSASEPSATAAKAGLSQGGQLELRARPGGGPGNVLVYVSSGGRETLVGGTVFHGASLVVDDAGPAGALAGHVLIKHLRSVNDKEPVLSVVSLTTGAVTSSLPAGSSPKRAITLSDGTCVVVLGTALVVMGPDGRVTSLSVGASDFFGEPS